MKVDMQVDASEFAGGCAAVLSRVSRGTMVAAQEGGKAILVAAQARCPVYTGTLRDSGNVEVKGSSANNYSPGFSATISFGNGSNVNPFTGVHPREYAAAVHEGFAVNPLTGEYSEYLSGEPKFLENAIRSFEAMGLHKLAYKHWGKALEYFQMVDAYKANRESRLMHGWSVPGFEKTRVLTGSGNIRSTYSDAYAQRDFFRKDRFGETRRNLTRTHVYTTLGIDADTPGMTDQNLYLVYTHNLRTIRQAHIYLTQANTSAVSRVSEEAIALANAFTRLSAWHNTTPARYKGTIKQGWDSFDDVWKEAVWKESVMPLREQEAMWQRQEATWNAYVERTKDDQF